MKSFVYGAVVGVAVTLGFLLAPLSAHAQWVDDGGYQVVGSTYLSGSGPGDFNQSFPALNSFSCWVDPKPTTNYSMSSSVAISRTLKKTYTWSGSLPNSGTFNVSANGTLSGNASAGPAGWASYVSSSSSSSVSFPPSGGVSSSDGSCSATGTNSPGSYAKNPSGNIVVSVGSSSLSTASFNFTISTGASGNIGVAANVGIATYHALGSVAYNIGNVVP